MNLWLRVLLVMIAGWRGARVALPGEASRLAFRVWPHDLDPSLHMNNGRYLTIMDLGRLDLMVRSGLLRAALRHRWTPIASAVLIRYRREMRLFQNFRLETRLVYFDDVMSVIEQVFVIEGGHHDGQVAARALFKGGLYDRASKSFVPIARLMQEIGISAAALQMTTEVEAYLAAEGALRQARNTSMGENA